MLDFLKPQTLCKDCKFYRHIVRNPSAPHVWYNHFCAASPSPESVDPVTGEKGYASRNDLGIDIIVEEPYHYCRDINKGNCHLFEKAG